MEKKFIQWDLIKILNATTPKILYIQKCENALEDIDKKLRKEKQECIYCYYLDSKVGGSVMTTSYCGICNKTLRSENTDTNALCIDCAEKHKLCKHCGGDINLKNRRKFWRIKENE
jgi:hypothetical protein